MKKIDYKSIAKEVINLEIKALQKLKRSLNQNFDKAVNDTTEIILNEIINTHKNILILSQNVILEVLKDGNLDLIKKANIALRFISFMRGRDDLSDKSNKRLSDYKFEKLFPIID